MAKITDLRKPK